MKPEDLKIGGRYNWRYQPERLVYMGATFYPGDRRRWHQFALVEKPEVCWSEVLDEDLSSFEETAPAVLLVPDEPPARKPVFKPARWHEPKPLTQQQREIADWNAAVEARKAEKRLRRCA
jgi:hypothetical protein